MLQARDSGLQIIEARSDLAGGQVNGGGIVVQQCVQGFSEGGPAAAQAFDGLARQCLMLRLDPDIELLCFRHWQMVPRHLFSEKAQPLNMARCERNARHLLRRYPARCRSASNASERAACIRVDTGTLGLSSIVEIVRT